MGKQTCKDCGGYGIPDADIDMGTWVKQGEPLCPTCDGTGTIHRTGPYRLADGTWSDRVDRKHEIAAYRFGIANPSRMSVNFDEAEGVFAVWKGKHPIKEFSTHAEAIRYADHHARTTKNGDA